MKKLLYVFCPLLLAICLLFTGCENLKNLQASMLDYPAETYSFPVYAKENDPSSGIVKWEKGTINNYTLITSSGDATEWNSGWYVVKGNVEFSNITCKGDVKLLLTDGSSLTVKNTHTAIEYQYNFDLTVPMGAIVVTGDASFSVFDQGNGIDVSGVLNVSSKNHGSSLGGFSNIDGNNITINGGVIHASSTYTPAIGGGGGSQVKNLVINGGSITAESEYASGIGGNGEGISEGIIINGGIISTKGNGEYAAGIGGSENSSLKNVIINGGTIETDGYVGIGSGKKSTVAASDIMIRGGNLTIRGCFGFGGGTGVKNLSISGGEMTVSATSRAFSRDGEVFLSGDLLVKNGDGVCLNSMSTNQNTNIMSILNELKTVLFVKVPTALVYLAKENKSVEFSSADEAFAYANNITNQTVYLHVYENWSITKELNLHDRENDNSLFYIIMHNHTISKGYQGEGSVIRREGNCAVRLYNGVISGGYRPNGDGGNISISGSWTFRMYNVTVKNGESKNGGGIYVNTDGLLTLDNCSITENQAQYGGGLYLGRNATKVSFTNTQVTNNTATASGNDTFYQE